MTNCKVMQPRLHAAKNRKYEYLNKQWTLILPLKRGRKHGFDREGRLTEKALCYIIIASILGHLRTVPGCLQWPYFWPSIHLMKELSAWKSKTAVFAAEDNCIAIMLMPRAVCSGFARTRADFCGSVGSEAQSLRNGCLVDSMRARKHATLRADRE